MFLRQLPVINSAVNAASNGFEFPNHFGFHGLASETCLVDRPLAFRPIAFRSDALIMRDMTRSCVGSGL
jgi:hypothetical protein